MKLKKQSSDNTKNNALKARKIFVSVSNKTSNVYAVAELLKLTLQATARRESKDINSNQISNFY